MFGDRGFVSAKGLTVSFFDTKERDAKKPPKGELGAGPQSKGKLSIATSPFPLWEPPTPHLGCRSLVPQRGSYYAFPSVFSTAFICRCTHEDGWCPNDVGCFCERVLCLLDRQRVCFCKRDCFFTFLSFPKKKGTKENCQRVDQGLLRGQKQCF